VEFEIYNKKNLNQLFKKDKIMQSPPPTAPIKTVLVTGANGFIASHIINILLQSNYKVIGTVRTLAKTQTYSHLLSLQPLKNSQLSFREADLDQENWDETVIGCDYVIHTASPFPLRNPKKESDIIDPVLKGIRGIVSACVKNKVKKIIYTSSLLTVFGGRTDKIVFSEEDWANPKLISPYDKSKYFGEKEMWNLVSNHREQLKLTVILPAYVIGPFFNNSAFSSGELLRKIVNNEFLGYPKNMLCLLVDVRDVALAHVKALENEATDFKRYCLCEGSHPFNILIRTLNEEFSKFGYKLPKIAFGNFFIKIASYFDKDLEFLLPFLGKERYVDNMRSIQDLGIRYRNTMDSLIDMVYSLINKQRIDNKINNKIMMNVMLDMYSKL